jgi:hypothetical protein
MKFKGKKISQPEPELVVIPRSDGDIVFLCDAILDYSEFEKLCPEPIAPTVVHRSGQRMMDVKDPRYLKAVMDHATQRSDWMILTSLKKSPDLEWETVDYGDPTTWKNYKSELESVFTNFEINQIMQGIMRANNMDETRMREARASFLQAQAQVSADSNSLPAELTTTPSGEPANDLVSDLLKSETPGTT